MSDQPQKYQNIREFLDNLPVVPCAWQPDNPNICNTCLRINDSVARICSVWAQAHEDAPLEEMEFDEEISLMPSIEAIEKEGCKVGQVASVLDRNEGGSDEIKKRGYRYFSFLTASVSGEIKASN